MTFYKKHLITLYGINIYSNSIENSKKFYTELLELPILEEDSDKISFRLPDNRILKVSLDSNFSNTEPKEVLTIRVRNGLPKMLESFRVKLTNSKNLGSNIKLSEIEKDKKGSTFKLIDPSGNTINFFQRSLFSSKA
jgi:catechol-2,3-dioxygenase